MSEKAPPAALAHSIRTDRPIGSACRMGIFLGDILFMQFRWTILFWSPDQKLRVDIFPPFLAVCSTPKMEFKMNSKYQKSPNTKKKRKTIQPKVISCGSFWSSPYWLENSFQDRYTHCLFLFGENIQHLKLDNFRKHAPPPKKKNTKNRFAKQHTILEKWHSP